MADTSFKLPTDVNEFVVPLPDQELRKLDFSALSYQRAIRAIVEYVQTYHNADFNDWVASNGFVTLAELLASETAKLALRADVIGNEAFFITARSDRAVDNHAEFIGQRRRRQTAATVHVEVSIETVTNNDVVVPAGTIFTLVGPDKQAVYYEIYRTPGDFFGDIVIPSGKRGIIAYGIEGKFASPFSYTSPGGPNQIIQVNDSQLLESPLIVTVATGTQVDDWQVVTEPIELYGPSDKVVEFYVLGDIAYFKFGDNVHGQALAPGQRVTIRYRLGGGVRGRIGSGRIDETRPVYLATPVSAPVTIRFRNAGPSSGGLDRETTPELKRRAPKMFAMHGNIVTDQDYVNAAAYFSHPYYGAILRASYAMRSTVNANTVILFVLASGPNGTPAVASPVLKEALRTYITQFNALDEVVVSDGQLKPVDVDMAVAVDRNFDAAVIQERVNAAVDAFFDVSGWSMGQPLYVSNLIQVVQALDGVRSVQLFSPNANFVKYTVDNASVTGGAQVVQPYELIVLGTKKIAVFYDQR
jgi:hypothetical protein